VISFSYWSIKLWFHTEGKLVVVLIIPSSWGFPTGPVRHQRATAKLLYILGLEKGDPFVAKSLEVVSMGVAMGLHLRMVARSRISKAYCCCDKNKPSFV
jgi:hypothetical protein